MEIYTIRRLTKKIADQSNSRNFPNLAGTINGALQRALHDFQKDNPLVKKPGGGRQKEYSPDQVHGILSEFIKHPPQRNRKSIEIAATAIIGTLFIESDE